MFALLFAGIGALPVYPQKDAAPPAATPRPDGNAAAKTRQNKVYSIDWSSSSKNTTYCTTMRREYKFMRDTELGNITGCKKHALPEISH